MCNLQTGLILGDKIVCKINENGMEVQEKLSDNRDQTDQVKHIMIF